jgi:hypothetical protein
MNKIIALLVLSVFMIGLNGCFYGRGHHALGNALMAAAIIGTAVVIASHDSHHHHGSCGCERRYHQGHWVYYYGGHWEYYDQHHGHWYYYQD